MPTSETAYNLLVDMGVALSEANAPMYGRWVVVPPWFHGLLLKDDRFVGNGTGFNQAMLQGGLVGEAAGFQIHLSNNVPNTNGAKYKILAGTAAAGSYAEQLVELEAYRVENNFCDGVKGLHVYGAKVVQPTGLVVATASKTASTAGGQRYLIEGGDGMTEVLLETLLERLQRKLSLPAPDSEELALLADELSDAEGKLLLYLDVDALEERFHGTVVELAALYYQQDKQSEDGGYASRSYTEGQVTQSDSYLTPSQLKQAEAEVLERIARYRRVSC